MINFKNYKQLLFLDSYEKEFCKRDDLIFNPLGDLILIQCTKDPFYLKLFSLVIEQEKNNTSKVYGVISLAFNIKFIDIILVIPFIVKSIINFGSKRKLKKMYSSIGVSEFIDHSKFNFFSKISNFFESISFFFKIKTKEELISFSYKGIRCGDLVYDTVVRFNSKIPTLNLRSFSYFINLYKSLNQVSFYLNFDKNLKFKKAFFSQAVYIYHGIPVRVFSSIAEKVYTAGNMTQMFKLVTREDYYMMESFKAYEKLTKKIVFNDEKIEKSLKNFKIRFEGKDDTGYISLMKSNPYLDYNVSIDKTVSFNGVLFLHDFYDAHKLFGEVIFNDFYEWAIFTLDIIRDNNLKIAIKPHPYQIPESFRFQEKIKSLYKDLIWLDPLISNTSLFNSDIKFGVTHHGTIIGELSYFKINCIYCAENPVSAFNIGHFAKSKDEYKDLLLNADNLKINENIKSEVAKYYYLHYIKKSSDYLLKSKDIDGINIKKIDRFNMKTNELLK
jgi:hypothetical protein